MDRFSSLPASETKKCSLCQRRSPKTAYFRGRFVCDECLNYVKNNL